MPNGGVTISQQRGDLFHMLNPHEYRMSFLYDSFTWSHCDDAGVKFPALDWGTDLA